MLKAKQLKTKEDDAMTQSLITATNYDGAGAGQTVLLLGRVHGNESSGEIAIRRVMGEIESGQIKITKGRVICIPEVNTAAKIADKRFTDRNLNRVMGLNDPIDNEGRIAEQLRPFLDQADYLLDLHSYTVGGPPFAFASDDSVTMAFARAVRPAAIITGWNDCFVRTFPDAEAPGMGTTEYARAKGATAITFECGQHKDLNAPEAGYQAIINALRHVGVVEGIVSAPGRDAIPHYRMEHIFMKDEEGTLAETWRHLQPVHEGQVFATFQDGRVLRFPQDGVVILPNASAGVQAEWGYMGVRVV